MGRLIIEVRRAFSDEEIIAILEIARVAMTMWPRSVGENLDISDEYLEGLRDRLALFMDADMSSCDKWGLEEDEVVLAMPRMAWTVLLGTLCADAESAVVDYALRREIKDALAQVEEA